MNPSAALSMRSESAHVLSQPWLFFYESDYTQICRRLSKALIRWITKHCSSFAKIPRRFLLRPRDGARDLARRPRDPGPAHIGRKRRNRTFSAHEREIGSIKEWTSPKRNTSFQVCFRLSLSLPHEVLGYYSVLLRTMLYYKVLLCIVK